MVIIKYKNNTDIKIMSQTQARESSQYEFKWHSPRQSWVRETKERLLADLTPRKPNGVGKSGKIRRGERKTVCHRGGLRGTGQKSGPAYGALMSPPALICLHDIRHAWPFFLFDFFSHLRICALWLIKDDAFLSRLSKMTALIIVVFFFNENVVIDWKCDRCVR